MAILVETNANASSANADSMEVKAAAPPTWATRRRLLQWLLRVPLDGWQSTAVPDALVFEA
jgi:hypothetical protein